MTSFSISQSRNIFETVNRIELAEVVEQYTDTPLKWRGNRATGPCPLHQEKTGSFTVYQESNSFYCFGCGAGGDPVAFVAKLFSLRPIDAARKIANDFGIQIDGRPLAPDEVAKAWAVTRQRELDRALTTWAEKSYGELCQLRRCCFKALEIGEDFLEHPEYYNLMQYTDHVLDCLQGNQKDKKDTLDMKLKDQLGLTGRWLS